MKNVLELLEKSASVFPEKNAFIDDDKELNYRSLLTKSKRIASGLIDHCTTNRPVAVFIDKSIECILAMFGVLYSGNFYVVIDTDMPPERIASICKILNPVLIITNNNSDSLPDNICKCIEFSELIKHSICEDNLLSIRAEMIDTDPAYVLFTSGSTGVPKGTVISHRNILAYSQWFTKAFNINEKTVFGNQTPLYFSMSVTDIYSTIRCAATMVLLPKQYFSFPAKVMETLKKYKVNTIYWVPSALGIIANWKALDFFQLDDLRTILFAGEVMPVKHLNYWRKHYPNALFANLFGPTETTDICTYYVVNRDFSESDSLPIGKPCDNCDVLIIDSNNKEAVQGELYVRGSFLAHGYYNNQEKTEEAFVQNPLNKTYPEFVYRTGDIVRYNNYGELEYIGRKDYQIKHMGYRIELGEIETVGYSVEGVSSVCCIYDDNSDEIVFIFEGASVNKDSLYDSLNAKLPHYMYPSRIIQTSAMPHNANGKIDRVYLRDNYKNLN